MELRRRATAALVAVTIPLLFLPAARPARAAQWLEFAKLAAADPGGVDRFGYGVAIWGERIAVGAPFDNSPSGDAGSVSVFERDADGVRFLAATLTASDAGESWNLGTQVAIWGDTVAATAPGADPGERGAVYVFERNGEGVWRETAKLIAPDGALFASSVTVSGDTLVVGGRSRTLVPPTSSSTMREGLAGGARWRSSHRRTARGTTALVERSLWTATRWWWARSFRDLETAPGQPMCSSMSRPGSGSRWRS